MAEAPVQVSFRVVAGCAAAVEVVVDEAEVQRRRAAGGRPILDLDLLNLLLQIPPGRAVTEEGVSGYDWALLVKAARLAAVTVSGMPGNRQARRCAVPPLVVRHVTVTAREWRKGLSAASRFAPYASRELVLDAWPARQDVLLLEASYLGIGVTVREDAGLCRVLAPEPFCPARYTGASWLFAERMLDTMAPQMHTWA